MRKILYIGSLVALFEIQSLKAQVEVTNFGDIPVDRIAVSRWQNFEWDGSGTWTTIDVSKNGITPNTADDISSKVNNLISNGSGKRILKFPAGTFQVKNDINISKDDIQIVGEGSSTKFILVGGTNPSSFSANGSRSGDYKLTLDAKRGDDKVTLVSASGLDVGDFFIVVQPGSVTRAGASGDETQIFKILAKSGNTLTLDLKFGIPFKKASTTIQKLNYRKNIRLSSFYMEMSTKPLVNSNNVSFNTVQNIEFSNIESNKAYSAHFEVFRAREVIFYKNNVYGNYGGGGSYQYGLKINWSTNCHMINNRAANLRHHYATQYGSNHCVIAYNRALPPYNDYADYGQHNSKGCHNNLFEGNYGSEIYDDANPLKSWGTRYTMWFRNHATSKVGSENEFVEYMNIIGNELKTGTTGIKTGAPGKYTLTGLNIVNISGEGGTGTLLAGNMSKTASIPASLFLNTKPSYVARWPLYGPTASTPVEPTNEPPIGSFLAPTITNLQEGYSELYVNIDAKDPENEGITGVTLYIDGVLKRKETGAPYEWGKPGSSTQNETLFLPIGIHLLEAEIEDIKGAKTTISTTIIVSEKGISYLSPIHDAYLQGTTSFNTEDLRLEAGNRTSYLKFDLTNLDVSKIEKLDLELWVGSDPGTGTVSVYNGIGNTWTESSLSTSNASTKGSLASTKTSDFIQETPYTFSIPVSFLAGSHTLNLIIEMAAGGNDVSFASKENETETGPLLKVKTGTITSTQSEYIKEELMVYPNPSTSGEFNLSEENKWEILSNTGNSLTTGFGNEVNIKNYPKGMYFLRLNDGKLRKILFQ